MPALPKAWKEGRVNGLKARGGFEIDMEWKDGRLTSLTVRSSQGGNCRLRLPQPLKAKGLKTARGDNANPLFAVPQTPDPIIANPAQLHTMPPARTWLYDLATTPGGEYRLR